MGGGAAHIRSERRIASTYTSRSSTTSAAQPECVRTNRTRVLRSGTEGTFRSASTPCSLAPLRFAPLDGRVRAAPAKCRNDLPAPPGRSTHFELAPSYPTEVGIGMRARRRLLDASHLESVPSGKQRCLVHVYADVLNPSAASTFIIAVLAPGVSLSKNTSTEEAACLLLVGAYSCRSQRYKLPA